MANPEFEDESSVDVFDFWEGANFKLKIRKVDGFSNYDKSEFITPAPLLEDSEMERIWGEQHSLDEFVDQSNFKTYDELKTRLDVVLGNTQTAAMSAPTTVDSSEVPFDGGQPISKPSSTEESQDENLDYFKKLAEA